MNTLKISFAAALTISMIIAVFCLLGIMFNPHGFWQFLADVRDGTAQALHAAAIGAIILFFAFLGLGIAYVAVHIRTKARVITPTRYGPAQAVQLRDGNWLQLASPAQQIDPMQQLQMLKTVMQMQGQMAQLAKRTVIEQAPETSVPQLEAPLPTNVLYDDIRHQVPRGHILVGVGRRGVETKERAVGACVWIVGLSGTGKTSTTVLRVEERHADGHKFLGVDPHWFKPDSLTNAVRAYSGGFLMPMARTPAEAKTVLQRFLDEFNGRKQGRIPKPWQKTTLLVDEVGALMDPTTDEEEEIKEMLPSIARICGQEARNFEMGGIFISQQATGLAWLRKMALMVIVHQLLMMSEKKLALNEDMEAVEDMKTWPVGRTYIYGVGFQEGPRTVQQPRFEVPTVVDSTPPISEQIGRHHVSELGNTGNDLETPAETARKGRSAKVIDDVFPAFADTDGPSTEKEIPRVEAGVRETIRRMKDAKESDRKIARYVGLSGRKYHLYQAICRELGYAAEQQQVEEM